MLQKRLIPIAFREGLDTKTSPENGIPGRLLELHNGVFGKIGQIRKRFGYDRLSSGIEGGTSLSACDALATFKSELLSFSSGRLYSWSDARSSWVDRGVAATALVTETSVTRNTYQQSAPAVAIGDGLTCVVYEDSRGGVRYSIADTATGASLVADAEASPGGTRPLVVAFNGEFVIFYAAGNNLFYRRIATSDPRSLGVEVNPVSTMEPTAMAYDVAVIGERLYVAFSGASSSSIGYFDTAFAATAVTGSLQACTIMSLFGDASNNAWIITSATGSQKLAVFDSAGATVLAETSVGTETQNVAVAAVFPEGATAAVGAFTIGTSIANYRTNIGSFALSGAATSLASARGTVLHGRAFGYEGVGYFPVAHESPLQSSAFVLSERGEVVAKASAGGARSRATMGGYGSASTGSFTFATTAKTALESVAGDLFTRNGVALVTLDFTGTGRFASVEIGNNLVVAGGVVNAYDGLTLAEQGFHLFPEGTTASVGVGGGGLTVSEVYRWKVVYEWTDAQGQVHRSAPGAVTISGADSYTSAAGSETITLTIPTLRLTGKSNVRIAVYRTEGDGSIYWRLTPIATPTLNDTTTDTVTFVDTFTDAAIVGNEILYTDGAANSPLENIAPPPASFICTHQGRAFLVAGPNKIAFSQVWEDGEAPAFQDAQVIVPDARGGDLVALASMDDKLVIFKDSAIFVTAGPGPDDTGAGEFLAPQLVTTDVGCSEARSVVSTSAGLLFKTAKGIYLLDRSLAVTYIGAQVEDYNGLTITSATLVASQNQVRFTTSGSLIVGTEVLSDLAIVYDYAFNQWSVFTNCGGVDSVVWDGTYAFAKSDGKTFTENTDSYEDAGSFVKLKLTTSWLSFAGVQGYQRVYRALVLGEYKSDHSLRVQIGYDFSPAFTYDQTLNAETVIAPGTWGSGATWGSDPLWGGAAPVEWFVAKPERQKCSSIRVSIEDSMDARSELADGSTEPYGAGFSISNLALLVGVKRGGNKLAASRVM